LFFVKESGGFLSVTRSFVLERFSLYKSIG
jgi:hypothetical protein